MTLFEEDKAAVLKESESWGKTLENDRATMETLEKPRKTVWVGFVSVKSPKGSHTEFFVDASFGLE